MAKLVVTGAAGFIGSHLVERLLRDGHQVLGIDLLRRGAANLDAAFAHPAFTLATDDLLTADLPPLLAGAQAVIHLAGQPGVRESWADFAAYSRGNIETTQRLLESLSAQPTTKFVLASTSSVYGQAPRPCREDGPLRPVSPYGLTKWSAEQLCDLYGRLYGIPWVALRYFTVYGPRQRPDMAFTRWMRAARQGEPIQVYGDGHQSRDFTYVSDTVEATVRAALSPVCNQAINVGGCRPTSVHDVLQLLAGLHGAPLPIEYGPEARGDSRKTLADTTRLRTRLGFVPGTPLATGLQQMWEWMCMQPEPGG